MRRRPDTVTALGVIFALAVVIAGAAVQASAAVRAPTAADFGRDFVRTANAYAVAHGSAARLRHPDCVQAAPGRYMCSYAVTKPRQPVECHLIQARWTPEGPSTVKVTLAGRTLRCESLRAALDSLS